MTSKELRRDATQPSGFKAGQPIVWYHRRPEHSNQHCLYCSDFVGPGSTLDSDREHLVARNFVPPGTLDADAFNFIFRACRACNHSKAEVERHLSTATLYTSVGRQEDRAIDELAHYKAARDYHPSRRGVVFAEAVANLRVHVGPKVKIDFVGPPQPHQGYAWLLALRHVQGLFAMVTTGDHRVPESMRLLPPDQFGFFGCFPNSDWGNLKLLELTRRVDAWLTPCCIVTARGYFKALLRRQEAPGTPWIWALEWNKSLRVIGWIGNSETIPDAFTNLSGNSVATDIHAEQITRWRRERPLMPGEDMLFNEPDCHAAQTNM